MTTYRARAATILAISVFSSACFRKTISVPAPLPVRAPASTEELAARITAHGRIRSFSARIGLTVDDYYSAEPGKAKSYIEVNGLLRLERPEKIRLAISLPVIGSDVADMMSDGQQFRVAVFYPSDKRMFLRGSNVGQYQRKDVEGIKASADPTLRQAGALANIRPQHVTDAFLIEPIPDARSAEYFREEVIEPEPDVRPGKRGKLINRTYYVLYVLERNQSGKLTLHRKFWFDRTQEGTPLARQQTFEGSEGALASDISYGGFFQKGDMAWPEQVTIERRRDGYSLKLHLNIDTVEVNPVLLPTTFELENTDGLKEQNLDELRKSGIGDPPTSTVKPK
ncbi:MAG TPA: hypothetical protein VFV34_24260 [Blastocatellia bacterium]|nr:hypothetical protein [Blastocatellia bacterium]